MKNEIKIYQPNKATKVEVKIEDETVWLTQEQMATLFGRNRVAITQHIGNIFKEGELIKEVVCKDFLLTTQHGAIEGKTQTRKVKIYNLDVIISVGYRVKSKQGTQFRIWAEQVLQKKNTTIVATSPVSNKIYSIRGVSVMLDRDIAEFYQTETRTLKQTVKRNINRFPTDFMFELTDEEIRSVVSQSVIPSSHYFGGAKPFAFTEQGVSMLSAVIKTDVAVDVSIKIIRAFIEVKKLALSAYNTQERLGNLEAKQIETDLKIDRIFNAIEEKDLTPKQGVFFDGQIFDAYTLVADIIRTAKSNIALIDNYVDDSVLTLFSKKNKNVNCAIFTKTISKQLSQDAEKFNQQYGKLTLHKFDKAHDRFLIIDAKNITDRSQSKVYHIGASLKDLGKKWFAFTKLDESSISQLLNEISKML